VSTNLHGNKILHLEMPAWLRGSPFEDTTRKYATKFKQISREIEKRLRGGKVRGKIPSTDMEFWLDYDFAIKVPLPHSDEMLAVFVDSLKPGNVVYDVGSYVGWYTIAALKRIGPEGRVFSFEPVPETAKRLRCHIELNQGESRARVIEAACGRTFGFISMPVRSNGLASGNGLFDVHPHPDIQPTYVEVCMIPLDEFWQTSKLPPDVIKIDVEGAELWVLEGARKILSNIRPTVFLEIHKFAWNLFETTEAEFFNLLDSLSYHALDIACSHTPITVLPERGFVILKPVE
jgi:FkbM family methyltransferase